VNLDDVLPDEGHLRKYRVWYTVEIEAEAPEIAAGMTAMDLSAGRARFEFQRVEEVDQ
jgi:hypothetical protein